MNKISPQNIQSLKENEVFVFGSNGEGHHGGGAARFALIHFGAIYGIAEGAQGKCYAINSMDGLEAIKLQIKRFIDHATKTPGKIYLVTEIGCGIAGYTPNQVAPLFKACGVVENIHLPESFWKIIKQ